MKNQVFLLLFLALSLIGCEKIDNEPMTLEILSAQNYTIDNREHLLKIAINSSADWELVGDNDWCLPNKTMGYGRDTLVLTITANTFSTGRRATFVIKNRDVRRAINVTQHFISDKYFYKLPVIFHILYNDPSDRKQNVEAAWLYEILNQVNILYQDSIKSENMDLEFIPATHDPEGNLLAEPGIHRVLLSTSTDMDCNVFMEDHDNLRYIWNPNQYINVMIYGFSNKEVLGISRLPYTTRENSLIGLFNGDRYFIDPTLNAPHCISINNKYLLTTHEILKVPDATLTLSHELGHYLGLFHVFIKDDEDDFCDDTPNYDRKAYEDWLYSLTVPLKFEELAQRTSTEGIPFTSYNIMDYDYSYLDRFTPDQRIRIRHVLEYSPLIPGPKATFSQTRSVLSMEIPEARTIE